MGWHPLQLMRFVFIALVAVIVIAALTTRRARPRTAWEWALVWAVVVFLAWALLGFAFLRSV
jgi:hypothetical protein